MNQLQLRTWLFLDTLILAYQILVEFGLSVFKILFEYPVLKLNIDRDSKRQEIDHRLYDFISL